MEFNLYNLNYQILYSKEVLTMNYCKNCGNKLKEGAKFCAKCGRPIGEQTESKSRSGKKETDGSHESKPLNEGSAKRRKKPIITIIALLALLLLGGGYYYLKNIYLSPDKVVEGFAAAVEGKQTNKVRAYINDGQREMKATAEQTEAFITYLNDNPKIYSELYEDLETEANYYKEDFHSYEAGVDMNNLANVKLGGKKWGIFDHYVIEVQPCYVNITSDYNKTEIQIDGQKAGTVSDEAEELFGPYLPGEHTIKAVAEGGYGKVTQSDKFDVSSLEDRTASSQFSWDDYFLSIYTNEDEAVLFVNGKSTKKKLKEIDEIGPLPMDGSVKLHAEWKIGKETLKSDTVTVKEGMYSADFLFDDVDTYDTEVSSEEDEDSIDERLIQEVIYTHYQHITDNHFEAAYNLFSSEKRSSLSLSDWSKGLENNQSDVVNSVSVKEINGSTAKAHIVMTSYDDHKGNTTLVQQWEGDWHLVKENGSWYLDKAKLTKISSKTES